MSIDWVELADQERENQAATEALAFELFPPEPSVPRYSSPAPFDYQLGDPEEAFEFFTDITSQVDRVEESDARHASDQDLAAITAIHAVWDELDAFPWRSLGRTTSVAFLCQNLTRTDFRVVRMTA